MGEDFYPFIDTGNTGESWEDIHYPARIAVWDDPTVTPRVVVVEPTDVRSYLDEITRLVTQLSHEQGGTIPFMIIREVVENFIHSYFTAPTVSILDGGNTIRFADQGPGIKEKELALEYGTTSATEQMKRYIRGVGSGLPLARQYMLDKGGSLTLADNIASGVIVTISTAGSPSDESRQAFATTQDHQPQPVARIRTIDPETHPEQRRNQARNTDPQSILVSVSPRGEKVLSFLSNHEQVGPSDLVDAYGGSQPTWSRELKNLDGTGLVIKRGQKRYLTEFGRSYLQQSSRG